jgi:hypothetical protein
MPHPDQQDNDYERMLEEDARNDSEYIKSKVSNPDTRFDDPRDDNGDPRK